MGINFRIGHLFSERRPRASYAHMKSVARGSFRVDVFADLDNLAFIDGHIHDAVEVVLRIDNVPVFDNDAVRLRPGGPVQATEE